MNIYDTANNLATEIKQSEEYKIYAELKKSIMENEDKKEKLSEFEKLRYEIQVAGMKGEKEEENQFKELQNKYIELMKDEEMSKYFEAEIKFNVMMADINKIIAEAVKDIL